MTREPIYEPKGLAAEYGELALNVFTGCPHGCWYCYAPGTMRKTAHLFSSDVRPREGLVHAIEAQLSTRDFSGRQVFLCFSCDPYPKGLDTTITRDCIALIKEAGARVKILSKRPTAAALDLDLLDDADWFGTTITGAGPDDEPGADSVAERLKALRMASDAGVRTWVSVEPVIDSHAVYELLMGLDGGVGFVDLFAFGKLNHRKSDIDWAEFGHNVEVICKANGLDYVIKSSLRKQMRSGFWSKERSVRGGDER